MIIPNIWENRIDVPNHQPAIGNWQYPHAIENSPCIELLSIGHLRDLRAAARLAHWGPSAAPPSASAAVGPCPGTPVTPVTPVARNFCGAAEFLSQKRSEIHAKNAIKVFLAVFSCVSQGLA